MSVSTQEESHGTVVSPESGRVSQVGARRPRPGPGVFHVIGELDWRVTGFVSRVVTLLGRAGGRHPAAALCRPNVVLERRLDRAAVPSARPHEGRGALTHWLLNSRAAVRLARGVRAAIVHAHGLDAAVDAVAAATRLRLPAVVSLYGEVGEEPPRRSSLRRVSRAITTAEGFRASAEEALGCRAAVVEPGLDPREFEEAYAPDRVIRDLALDPNTIRIAAVVSDGAANSGGEVFVEAAADVLRSIPFCEFVVIGAGPRTEHLEALAHQLGVLGRFRFVPHDRGAPRLLSAMSAVAFPGQPRSFPWALAEAAACPLPILAADCSVHREMLAGEPYVKLLPQGDAGALAGEFRKVLCSRGTGSRVGSQYVMAQRSGGEPRLVRSRPSLTGYDLSSGDLSTYDMLADDYTARRGHMLRRYSLEAAADRLSDLYFDVVKGWSEG